MSNQVIVIELGEATGEGSAKLVPGDKEAQEHIATRVNAGVAPDRIKLYSASETPFGVTYQPIISIGVDGPKTPQPGAVPAGATPAPQAKPAPASTAEPAAAQSGVSMSSQFPRA